MKIKSFTAESVAEALKRVRSEMGNDAFLLKTRRFTNPLGNERVEVTACSNEENGKKSQLKQDRTQINIESELKAPKPNATSTFSIELSAINNRLDAIEEKLAFLICQITEKQQNMEGACANIEQNAN